ncbi:NAD(P)H-quinone dehydrogenase [Fodinicola acaciae]|uniref:NAD(P)H-quinone dehydrogenase n=1 Tax=Fodinicola acaciae TaxID=2681555 RepID=UPI0013D46AAC|nr:NAD(P)H-quinone dehydrogenase [Fodinicola acaciae]
MTRIVIIGGGPAGYEAALVAAQLGAEVSIVEADAIGGACVVADCVPSKTFIASSDVATTLREGAPPLGIKGTLDGRVEVDLAMVHARVRDLAKAQSRDIAGGLVAHGVQVLSGTARLRTGNPHLVEVDGGASLEADIVLVATGATPRVVPGAEPDGERILTWRQVYELKELPEHLVVIGSGVTGAEFASAYLAMGVPVTLVSSRDRVMPHEDRDAAEHIEEVFARRGMSILSNARADAVRRTENGVRVELQDGRTVEASHALMTVGSVPNTAGLAEAGVALDERGFVAVDRVSRTSVRGVYAAGDCTGVLMLASVAAMQGRIAMWHALGEAVQPLRRQTVAANVFTDPEIASVGLGQSSVEAGTVPARTVTLPLATNARAKMMGLTDGFVKLFCRPASGLVIGGVVVAPRASELILPIAMAVENHLTVNQIAQSFSIYPSLSGSITEAARQLMQPEFE